MVNCVSFGSGTLTLTNSTVSGNKTNLYGGGGVLNCGDGTLVLARTLVSGNTAKSAGQEVLNYSTVIADDFNLVGHNKITTAKALSGFTPGVTDLLATSDGTVPTALAKILDPALADNSGPTLTHALVAGSPAIDAVGSSCPPPTTDQRGIARPQGAACDIGAVEDGAIHDFAILKITAPKIVALTSAKPEQPKALKVQIQNQGTHAETIPDADTLARVISLTVEALDTPAACPNLPKMLDAGKLKFPLLLKPKQKLTVSFAVTFGPSCIPDPLRSSPSDPGHEDYRLLATVDHSELLGEADAEPADDVCPRMTLKDGGCAKAQVDVVDKR